MRKGFLSFVAALALAPAAAAQEPRGRLVTMTGYGIVQGTPDRAWVNVGVEVRDPQTKVAQEQAAIAMQHIQERLRSLGIPESALRTSSFNVMQDWEFFQGRRTLRGYVVSNRIEVKVDDISKVPAIIDGAIGSGANIIQGVRWDMKDREALEKRALQLAFEDARARAAVIAAASGNKLGAVMAVQESRVGAVRPTMMSSDAQFAAGAGVAQAVSVVNAGEMEIRATVTVSFLVQS